MSLPLQDVLEGKYEILEKIGEGGIGSVYKVKHRLLEEIRVIKVLRPEAAAKEELRERFLHEARMAIRLKHPNIAQLHDFSIAEDGRAYIVMEFIDGVALDALLAASGPPSLDLSLEIARQALAALHYLHENDFIHRDVSPDNLMLASSFDGRPLVKLIDLGIARHLGAEVRLTATGVFLGKARYCSPEQLSAAGDPDTEVDRRGDIYSFGVLLYELLTGVYPMHGENFAELAGSHLFHPPKDFSETDPEGLLPEGVRQAVLRALAKDPDDRFATAADLAAELDRYRNPESAVGEEFDRTVELATTSLPRTGGTQRPGSTQDRLNRQFGLETTPSPTATPAAEGTIAREPRKPLTECVMEIETLIARGRRKGAIRALDRALADHGAAAPLIDLRAALEQPATAATSRRRPPLAALAALAVVVVAAALGAWWWLGGEPPEERAAPAAPDAEALLLEPALQWDPAATAGEPSPLAEAVDEPPPIEPPPSAAGPGPAAAQPASPPPQPQPAPAADGSQEPQAGSEQPGPEGTPAGEPPPGEPPGPGAGEPPPAPRVSQEIFALGVGVVPPVLLEPLNPVAPDDARKLKEELTVIVKVLVDETGKVSRAVIADGPTFRRKYRDAALEAAEKARFRPARKGNTIGQMWTQVRVTFKPE